MKLTKPLIDGLFVREGQRDRLLMDDQVRGLGVRVTAKGTKVFVFSYRRGALVRRLRIGVYGDITLAQARRIAEEARGRVAAGGDPVAERRAAIEAEEGARQAERAQKRADALTLEGLIAGWAKHRLADRSPGYRREAPRALRHAFAGLLDRPAHDITSGELRRALDAMAAETRRRARAAEAARGPDAPAARRTGTVAQRRIRTYGAAAYAWAMRRELVPANPFLSVSIEGRETPRDRVLTDAEIGEAWRAAATLGWPLSGLFRFLLLTLQRGREVADLRWPELAPDLATWTLPGGRAKNRRQHVIHLAEPARDILRTAPRLGGSDFVFTADGRHAVADLVAAKARLTAAIERERAAAAAEGTAGPPAPATSWTLHDFRRTGVTVLAGLGVRWEVADRLLNHVAGAVRGVAAIYQRAEFLPEREAAMRTWADHVLACSRLPPASTPPPPRPETAPGNATRAKR